MLTAIVLGGAACVWEDMAAALELFTPDLVVATNHAGMDHQGRVDHWCTMHPELLPTWIAKREAKGLPPAGQYWTAERRLKPVKPDIPMGRAENWGGSSGMLAPVVAVYHLGCTRVVLCGVPMDAKQAHYDDPRPWADFGNYRRAWITRQTQMTAVRSMSGWTRQLLGAPTKEWFDEGQEKGPTGAGL